MSPIECAQDDHTRAAGELAVLGDASAKGELLGCRRERSHIAARAQHSAPCSAVSATH